MHIKFEKREELIKELSEELMLVEWHLNIWWDWYMPEDQTAFIQKCFNTLRAKLVPGGKYVPREQNVSIMTYCVLPTHIAKTLQNTLDVCLFSHLLQCSNPIIY